MESFYSLSTPGQVERLARLGRKALVSYGLPQASLRLIRYGMNAVFQADSPSGRRYCLRIHPGNDCQTGTPLWLGKQEIESELHYIRALAREGVVSTALPVEARDGSLVQTAQVPGVPEPRCCVLFEWVDADFSAAPYPDWQLFAMGEALGRLHAFGGAFTPPPGFVRPRLDFDGLFGPGGLFCMRDPARKPPEWRAFYAEVEDALRERMAPFSKRPGLILHGDYYYGNLFVQNKTIGMIDFDMCGWGSELFDLYIPYWPKGQENTDDAYRCFYQGYRSVRPLPAGAAESRSAMAAVRHLMDCYWLLDRWDLPDLRAQAVGFTARCAPVLRSLLGL